MTKKEKKREKGESRRISLSTGVRGREAIALYEAYAR